METWSVYIHFINLIPKYIIFCVQHIYLNNMEFRHYPGLYNPQNTAATLCIFYSWRTLLALLPTVSRERSSLPSKPLFVQPLRGKRNIAICIMVLLGVNKQNKTMVWHWFCLGVNEKALVLQWLCLGVNETALVL